MTMIIAFAYEITMITPVMPLLSRSLVSKGDAGPLVSASAG
jgi:hypothetical protein